MSSSLKIVEGGYLRDILDQPRALEQTLRGLRVSEPLAAIARRLASGGYRRVVLSGMGSSCHGLVPLQLRLVGGGHAPLTVDSSELLYDQRSLLADDSLLVLVSQSGRSVEIVRLLETLRGRPVDTIGVTNTAESPLAAASTAVVLTAAGEEATVSCKTYLAAQAALALLGETLCDGDADVVREALLGTVSRVAAYLSGWREHVCALAALLPGVRALFYAGRGPSLAAAGTAGLITKESTHRPAEGMGCAAFRHGPMEMLDGDVFLLVFAGGRTTRSLNEALVADARAAGARAYLAAEDAPEPAFRLPAGPDVARPLVELLPVEMITLALGALDGREAGRFERATKVTATE